MDTDMDMNMNMENLRYGCGLCLLFGSASRRHLLQHHLDLQNSPRSG